MDNWKEYKLGEIIHLIGGGTPKTSVPEYWNGDIPWLSVSDFNNDLKYVYDAEKKITQLGLDNSSTKILSKEQIIISARGTVGVISMIGRDMAFNQSNYGIDGKEEFIENHFLYYLLKDTVNIFISNSYGAVFNTITKRTFDQIDVTLPPLPEQKAIAEVLSSLDDKIDLLHRQNQTLEAMAETLFRQWFVEEANVDWEERPLSYFGKIICGKTPSKKKPEYFDGEYPFIKIPDMHGNTFVFSSQDSLSKEGFNSQINKALPSKSINVSCIATVGLVTMNAYPSQTNQQINSIIPDEKYRFYLYCEMKNSYDLLHAMASGGTATLNLNTGNFSKIPVAIPDEETLGMFNDNVTPLFDKIFINQQQIQTLTKLRDTLLPKLMSGEIRVNSEKLKVISDK